MDVGDRVQIIGENDVNNFYKMDLSKYGLDGVIIKKRYNSMTYTVKFVLKFMEQVAEFRGEDLRVI